MAEDILAAAAAVIDETGDESSVTLSGIARRVGVAVPSIYLHFPNVQEICSQVVTRAWQAYLHAITVDRDRTAAVAEQIEQFALDYVGFARRSPGLYRVLFARAGASALQDVHNEAGESFTELVAAMASVLGLDPLSVEARNAATGVWIQLHGIADLPPAHPRFAWPDDATLIREALLRSGVRSDGTS
ncbi:TetR/AcrR family transcriptional regulator [Variovorax sp. PBS-H4]|uniref:TetR/AcrR family transcriptional regulator n=1 Tax=Variovorax sp. PBS-H4 TaxID=434008 RepID=UPI0013A552C0|nr:TetR/AcrR family transcriptional regulator [Variovorax sp. PBS-H4]